MATFFETVTAAVKDMAAHGYDSPERLAAWVDRIRQAAKASMVSESELADALRRTLGTTYHRMVDQGGLLKTNPGVAKWTIEKVRPELRRELDRRLLASAGLIKLNRDQAVEKTLQRFTGWATSIPVGGSRVVEKVEVKDGVRKALAQLPFEERRVIIDQGHKLTSALNDIVATDGGAIAAVWHSKWRQPGYNYRDPHKARDEHVYTVRGNWALAGGLMKAGPSGYTDQITQPAEEPFCRCSYVYLYNLRDLPDDMLTVKGRSELSRVRAAAGTA